MFGNVSPWTGSFADLDWAAEAIAKLEDSLPATAFCDSSATVSTLSQASPIRHPYPSPLGLRAEAGPVLLHAHPDSFHRHIPLAVNAFLRTSREAFLPLVFTAR